MDEKTGTRYIIHARYANKMKPPFEVNRIDWGGQVAIIDVSDSEVHFIPFSSIDLIEKIRDD